MENLVDYIHLVNSRLRVRKNVIAHIKRTIPTGKGKILVKVGQHLEPADILGEGESPSGFTTVDLAGPLGVHPKKVPALLKRTVGQNIYVGELLAQKDQMFGLGKKIVVAPSDGILDCYDEKRGALRIKFLPKKERVVSGLYGIVDKIDEVRGEVVIRTMIDEVFGVFGSGEERCGILRILGSQETLVSSRQISSDYANQIIVGGGLIFQDALQKAINLSVKGIICGGINATDYKGMTGGYVDLSRKKQSDVGVSIVITEGFGSIPISDSIFRVLSLHDEKFAIINGNLARIILSTNDPASMSDIIRTSLPLDQTDGFDDLQPVELSLGNLVRIISSLYMGVEGVVESIDKTPTRVPSGVDTFMVTVKTLRTKIRVPINNLEVIR